MGGLLTEEVKPSSHSIWEFHPECLWDVGNDAFKNNSGGVLAGMGFISSSLEKSDYSLCVGGYQTSPQQCHFPGEGFHGVPGIFTKHLWWPRLRATPCRVQCLPCGLHSPKFVDWAGRKERKPTSATSLIPVSDNMALGRAHNELTRRDEH